MKKVLLSIVAATTLATALPALAQPYQRHGGYDNWTPVSQRIDRLNERIERGMHSGQITRGEGRRLRGQLFQLANLERHWARDGLSRRERAELDQRFDQLRMQIRFERRDDDRRWDRDDDRRDGRRGY